MEGGGNTSATKAALRQGMDDFLIGLKNSARAKSWHWKLVCCGGRDQAFNAFKNARNSNSSTIVVLLVDSEGPVNGRPCNHLIARDSWDMAGVPDDDVFLMVQTMEAWIVADLGALQSYYGQRFGGNALPKANDLDTVSKIDVANALDQATRRATPKGIYKKIRHASDLLKRIDPQIVRQRCPSCDRLFVGLENRI
jgi:hypothetical protein